MLYGIFKEHTNAPTVVYLVIYLFFTRQIFLVIIMYNALFYILYLVMYFIDSILIFILHTKASCYLFVSSIIKQYIYMYMFVPRVSVLRYMK